MPAPSELLRRFRLHVVPGVAAAVPVDHGVLLERELAPVFSLLRESQRRAESLVEEGRRQGDERRRQSSADAVALLAGARTEAATERSRAAAVRLDRAGEEQQEVLEAARSEAARIDAVAAARRPALVDEVVRRVLATGIPDR